MYRLKLLCATLLTHWLLVSGAFAVVVDINIQTEGDPVPQAEISFQTLDGDPIDLALF
nr:hypothetical protein [uncultured Cohaesibacter sp.]